MTGTVAWLRDPLAIPNERTHREAEARQALLTKPPGSLGRLESLAIRLAALQGTERPDVARVHISVFAGDHGIATEGVSAFPQTVTGEMVRNFARGGAAISVLARELGATLEIVNLGTVNGPDRLRGVTNYQLGPGTANFAVEAAMSEYQLARALHAGRDAVERAKPGGMQLFIGGDMGIGNTTAATALACALLDIAPEDLAGPGTGLDANGVRRKIAVLQRALALHRGHITSPLEALRRVGGFEIAALTGSYVACAQMGLPALVDGYIASTAALVAAKMCPGVEHWMLFSHVSAEPGHRAILQALGATPLLDLGMRLGEGSGAAAAVPLLRMACALHNRMATFAEARVSVAPGVLNASAHVGKNCVK